MSKPNPTVDSYFQNEKKWHEEIAELRKILLKTDLTEELKWECPCYTLEGVNIVLIHVFKEYCALLFHKGVLLKDPRKILIQQTPNVQSARQIRFTNLQEIKEMESVIKDYVEDAIKVEKSGAKVEFKKTAEFEMPDELKEKLEDDPNFKEAFEKLTPGRQRGYILFFSAPKQSQTRLDRIEKYTDRILDGFGVNDDYS